MKRRRILATTVVAILAAVAALAGPQPAQAAGSGCSVYVDSTYNWSQRACIAVSSTGLVFASSDVRYGSAFNGSHVVAAYVYLAYYRLDTGLWSSPIRVDVTADARAKRNNGYAPPAIAIGAPGGVIYRTRAWLAVRTIAALYNSGNTDYPVSPGFTR